MSDEIYNLKLKIFELTAEVTAANIRIRALQDLFGLVLEEDSGRNPDQFRSALKELEVDRANETLRAYADKDQNIALILKQYLDQHFPPVSEDDDEV